MTGARVGRPATITTDDLVDAAERVVGQRGGGGLTFDAVAREAGVSKGAVLHHFSTKDALLIAMIERLAARESVPAMQDAPDARSAVQAHVERVVRAPGDEDATSATLLAAVARDVDLLAPLKVSAGAVIASLTNAGLSADRAALLHFALDGLWISELLGTSPLSAAERERLIASIPGIIIPKDVRP